MRTKFGDKSPAQVSRISSPPALLKYVVVVADVQKSVGVGHASKAFETLTVNEQRSPNNLTQKAPSSLVVSFRKYVQSRNKESCS
jgi:hypothetical protein